MSPTAAGRDVAKSANFEQFINSLRDPEFPAPIVSARRFSEALHRRLPSRLMCIAIR